MADQNDIFLDGHVFAKDEDGPEVEGHIGRPEAEPQIRIAGPEESLRQRNDEDEGPDVEGHVFL